MLPALIMPAPTQWVPLHPNSTCSAGYNVILGVGRMESGFGFMFPFRLLTLFTAKNSKMPLTEDKFKVNTAYKSALDIKLRICIVANVEFEIDFGSGMHWGQLCPLLVTSN